MNNDIERILLYRTEYEKMLSQALLERPKEACGLKPLGNWHSHPQTPSRPSEEDKRLAYDKHAVYMILSLAEKEPILNAFHIENGEVRKEFLEIVEGE